LGVSRKEALVLGAGVSGLSSAILLLQEGFRVHIWAREFSPQTTSDVAAAVWYPFLVADTAHETVVSWASATDRYLRAHALDDLASGCVVRTVREVFDKPVADPWWRDAVERFRRPSRDDLPAGYVDGYETDVLLIDASRYMAWLMRRYELLGGTYERREVKTVGEALEEAALLVNCTGLGSQALFGDTTMYPVRGQVVLARSNGYETVLADLEASSGPAAIVPRLDDIVLGVTVQPNDWNLDVDPADTEAILQRVRALSEAFADVDIIAQRVGLRPGRPSVRVELEHIDGKPVIHNYGHGGNGYTLSWGCAHDVAALARDL
jgi:D-amino-acid oxidase